jgi:two-component system, chemotaxis family, response regulator WspR
VGVAVTKRIVVVDDSSLMRSLLIGLLDEAGYGDVTAFATLAEGWAYLEREDVEVNLILMDKALPDGDGIDAIRRIRETPHLSDKPVIMVTGFDDRDTLRAAFDAGATDFINKKFDETELQTRVRSALKLDAALEDFKAREIQLRELTIQLRDANHKLERQSLTDGLTGVANRRHFDQALERAWQQALETGQGLSVAMLDVDHFKKYNDHFGHQQGDECLCAVAQALESAVRLRDSARDSDLIARYGGEEFAAVLRTDAQYAPMVAERMLGAVRKLQLSHPHSSAADIVTISVGVASVFPMQVNSSLKDLCAAADGALYRAKHAGRNRVVVADTSTLEPVA